MNGITKANTPEFQSLLQRGRLKAQFERAFQNALITVVAPIGYAKTHEVANYLKNIKARLVWMHMTELDNLPEHFWNHYTSANEADFSAIVPQLKELGFPETLAKMDTWLRIVANDIYRENRQTVYVVDEFDLIWNEDVKKLIDFTIQTALETFSLVLISRQRTNYDLKALQSGGGVARITEKQLKFTVEDIEDFFIQSNIHLPLDEITLIHERTDGWPLLIYLLSRQIKDESTSRDFFEESLDVVYSMFEAEFFSKYDGNTKKTLATLAALPSFSAHLIETMGDVDIVSFTEMLRHNNFVSYDSKSREYTFQNSYREFLKHKQNKADIARIQSIAGDHALLNGQQFNAIEYYSQCGRYNDMLDVIVDFIATRMGINRTQIEYFSKKLKELPPDVQKENYLVRYIEVCLLIQMLQVDEAFAILKEMEGELIGKTGEKERAMLDEVYERMAGVHMMQGRECFIDYYKKAYEYIPNGSAYKKKSMLRYKNYSIVSLQDYDPGAIERMEQSVYDGFKYMNAIENGASAGFQYLFSAETSYYTFDLKRALNMAHKALYEAENGEAYDIACDALLLLARISLMRGKYQDVVEYIQRLEEYIKRINVSGLNDLVEFSKIWLNLSLDTPVSNTSWIRRVDADISINVPLVIGRDECMYALHLIRKRRYSEMVAYLEQVRPWYFTKGWGDGLVIGIMLSIGYQKLGDEERAIDTLKEIYDLTYKNKIIAPYIEFSSMMRTLIEHVRKSGRNDFDPAWLDSISAKSTTFAKRMSYMSKEHARQNKYSSTQITPPLTDRELDVLRSITQGLTREEIAEEKSIKRSTVKSVIRSIYNKLGAVNRADAIRIAMESDILK